MNISEWIDEPALNLVAEFNRAFGHDIAESPITTERLSTDLALLRFKLIHEEFEELKKAFNEKDLLDFIDAIQDLKYVLYGAELALGIDSETHFAEVHDANMRKLGPDGNPIYREDGKILKPEGWVGPDHLMVLESYAT